MKTKRQYALRPYHNPDNADESLVPPGWRMLYADEFPMPLRRAPPLRLFIRPILIEDTDYNDPYYAPSFSKRENCTGRIAGITYIIPVTFSCFGLLISP